MKMSVEDLFNDKNKLHNILGKSVICFELKCMIIFGNDVIYVPLSDEELEDVCTYIELSGKGIKLKRHPQTNDERKFKKIYHHLYNKERNIKLNQGIETNS